MELVPGDPAQPPLFAAELALLTAAALRQVRTLASRRNLDIQRRLLLLMRVADERHEKAIRERCKAAA